MIKHRFILCKNDSDNGSFIITILEFDLAIKDPIEFASSKKKYSYFTANS